MPTISFPRCRHRGEERGNGVRRCHSPKLIGLKLVTPDGCESCYCRDHATDQQVVEPGRIRHLLYHVYPRAAGDGAVWRWNVAKLRRRINLFNGRRVIGIAVGPETEPAAAVQAALAGCGCEFVETANDPSLREVTTFRAMYERVAGFTGSEHATLYAHAKGITSEAWAPGVRKWTETLYESCLDHWPSVRQLLASRPVAGPFRRIGYCFTTPDGRVESRSDWHYHGSWRWFRNADLFSRNWQEIDRFWCGIETHPSLHFSADEAAGMVCEIPTGGLGLYVEDSWREWAGAVVADWREDHLPDRWQPLLLTCILTSHRKPGFVHESIQSVLSQTSADWQLVVIDSGDLLAAGAFDRYRAEPRIVIVASNEAAEMGAAVNPQAWKINQCFRRRLVCGDLVCYLPDDDVYDPGIFEAWLSAARSNPWQAAWYGPADRCEVRASGEVKVGELPTVGLGGRGGVSLDCQVDGMQICHRRGATVPWPEDPSVAHHADGVFMDALGKAVAIHPIAALVGRHRHTADSTFTRPNG